MRRPLKSPNGSRGPVAAAGSFRSISSSRSLLREKEAHDPAQDSYPQNNAGCDSQDDRKKKGQLEDQKEQRDQQYAYQDRQAACGKVFWFQHQCVSPVSPCQGESREEYNRSGLGENIRKRVKSNSIDTTPKVLSNFSPKIALSRRKT